MSGILPRAIAPSLCIALFSCTNPSTPPMPDHTKPAGATAWAATLNSAVETESLDGTGIPLVTITEPGKTFDPPSYYQAADGAYSIYLTGTPSGSGGTEITVDISGSPEPAPASVGPPIVYDPVPGGSEETPRKWLKVYAPRLKKEIRYFFLTAAMGDTDDTWQSEIFSYTSADGRTGSYRVTCEVATDGAEGETHARRMFSKLGVLAR